jgi:hypothetical protein
MKNNPYNIRMEAVDQLSYKCIVYESLQRNTDSNKKFSESDIIQMLEFLMDHTFVIIRWTCFSTDSHNSYLY